jgi:hypothetical protein
MKPNQQMDRVAAGGQRRQFTTSPANHSTRNPIRAAIFAELRPVEIFFPLPTTECNANSNPIALPNAPASSPAPSANAEHLPQRFVCQTSFINGGTNNLCSSASVTDVKNLDDQQQMNKNYTYVMDVKTMKGKTK